MHFGGFAAGSSGGPPELLANDDGAVARVQTTAPDGSVTTCADVVPVQFDFGVHGGKTEVAAGLLGLGGQTPSAGRCAGPTSGDLAAMTLPARRLADGYDLSGRTSLTTGPFAVTVISGMRARITFGPSGGGGEIIGGSTGGTVKEHSVLVEHASVTYRVIALSGALTTNFAGLAPPECDALGACGATGRLVQSFATRGKLSFSGARTATRHLGRDRALQDLRRGAMALSDTFGEQAVHETVDESSAPPDGPLCSATGSAVIPAVGSRRPRRGSDELSLSGPPAGFGGADPFRTPCPGPGVEDILGPNGATIATATVTAGQLGESHLSITFHSDGTFHGSAYAGRRSGAVVLSLALVRSTGGTQRVRLFPGEPLIP
jgi:hypothetical protein